MSNQEKYLLIEAKLKEFGFTHATLQEYKETALKGATELHRQGTGKPLHLLSVALLCDVIRECELV